MVVAYVLVKATTGDVERLKNEMSVVDGVDRAHVVAGDVDILARVEVDSPAAVRAAVVSDLQSIDGVADTRTYLAMD